MTIRKISLFLLLFFFPFHQQAFAQLDCCGGHGGNYACDFSTSKLYCADGTVSTSCTCSKNTPTPTMAPTPTLPPVTPTPSPTIPACPNFSRYDSSSKSCKCISGYVVNDNVCITNTEYCWIKYGGNSAFDKEKNNCACPQGYSWNSNSTKCITLEELCENKLGSKSYYNNETNSCNCYQGYAIQNNTCQPIPTQIIVTPQTSVSVPTQTPTPTTKPKPTLKPKVFPTLALKGLGKDFSVNELVKPQPNIFAQILKGLWDFVRHLI